MASNALECDICCNVFSEDHCPRILPCSHTFCGPCVDELISTQSNECPVCREEFRANSAEDLMIVRKLLDAAKQLASMHQGSKALSRTPVKPFLETTKYFRANVIEKGIAVCEETEVEVNDSIDSNNKMRGGLEGFIQKLEEIKLSCKDTWSNIARDNKLLMDKVDIMKGKGQQMKDSEDKVETATDFASAASPMDEANLVLHEVGETANEIKQLLRDNKNNMKQDALRIKRNFEEATKDLGRIIEELEGDSVVNSTVTDLLSRHGRLRGDAQREIFAVLTFKGKVKVAPVKTESNIYVNCLEEGRLPPRCFVIELESLMQGSPSPSFSSPPRAFLDLAYGSTHLGRVIIKVFENCMKSLNFLYMCAVGMGPSYANSQVSDVSNHLFGGDYISMGFSTESTQNQAVLSSKKDWESEMETKTRKLMPWKVGDVRGLISYEDASQFWIVTRDDPRCKSGYCFGKVEEGLNVLNDAILKYPDRTNIKVAQCGLVL
ncbi:uncharacterized protein [Macrobrachium rosenbergii]|uniref:uncharacterized protein n=1 Tax=Macrobrachium rosenbergii TaxID=79674 RepID=UPI0034D63670